MAPYNLAVGPKPEDTPNANTCGNATIPAVKLPNTSPIRFSKNPFIFLDCIVNNNSETIRVDAKKD